MTEIYLVHEHYEYEPGQIISIHSTLEGASKSADEHIVKLLANSGKVAVSHQWVLGQYGIYNAVPDPLTYCEVRIEAYEVLP